VKHELKGVLQYKDRSLDTIPAPTPVLQIVTDIARWMIPEAVFRRKLAGTYRKMPGIR
jgi:hypothetical protein